MVEGAIYKVNPLVGEDGSDYVDPWDQDINQEDHSKILSPKQSSYNSVFYFSAFSREKMRWDR